MSRWITDELNAETPQARRERLRLYRDMVEMIALNDDPGGNYAMNVPAVAGYTTVVLAAAVFGKEPVQVARAVVRVRRRQE
jgi:hypothetical protein